MKLKLLLLLVLGVSVWIKSNANIYYVANNANSGGNTLRSAINNANDHPGKDTIRFSLQSDIAGRTIIVGGNNHTPLPSLTDPVDIDATSQQNGLPFGISNAMVQLTSDSILPQAFDIEADSCEIYGFFISSNFTTGIFVNGAYARIGSVNHGNVICNCSSACINVNYTDHAIIIGNFIGIDTIQNPSAVIGDGILLEHSSAITIGGHSTTAKNIISGNNYGVHLDNSAFCSISGNYIGTDVTGSFAIPNGTGIEGTGVINSSIDIGDDSLADRNIISGNTNAGIEGKFETSVFVNNFIGVDSTGINALGNGKQGINLLTGTSSSSSDNEIGGIGPYLGNVIANNGSEAIKFQSNACTNNTIRGNSTYCNGNGGFKFYGGNGNVNPPKLVIANSTGVTGNTYGKGTVDIFQDDGCSHCEGQILLGSVQASSSGAFTLLMALSGSITATVTDTNGNTSEYADCVEANSSACVVADFIHVPPAVCTGSATTFLDQSLAAPGSSLITWNWDFGDATTSTEQSPLHEYLTTGSFTVTLIATNNLGCSDTVTKTVSVGVPPIAAFTAVTESCVDDPIDFHDESSAGSGATLTKWNWEFGDGFISTQQNPPDHAYGVAGVFTASLTVTNSNGCTDVATQDIHVYAEPAADFTFSQSGLIVYFTNASNNSSHSTYQWDFGDGGTSASQNPYHTYGTFGVYTVCLTIFDSICMLSDSSCVTIDLPTGMSNISSTGIGMYPNPASNTLTIFGLGSYNYISILNMLGQEVISFPGINSEADLHLDVESVKSGEYFLLIRSDENSMVFRISISR